MAEIKVSCKCGRNITVNIKTIDVLRSRCEQLEKENITLKKLLNPIESEFDELLNKILRGKR